MEQKQLEPLMEIMIETGISVLVIFSIVALLVGIILVFAPQKIERLRQISDQWITARKLFKRLETPIDGDSFLYRNHKWVGAVAIILPVITLYLLLYSVAGELPRSSVPWQGNYHFWQWLNESAIIFLWVTNVFAFIVGILIFFEPSLLKRIEERSNRWLSTRQGLRRIDRSYSALDELVLTRSRWVGLFLILGSLYALVLVIAFILQHPDWLDLLVNHLYK